MSDKHARIVVTVAVTSAMLAASTSTFAWCFARFTATEGYRYCFPLIVYGTIWMMVVVFAAGVGWALAEQVSSSWWLASPPRPSRPPEKPGDTPRPMPAPIQPPPPKPGQLPPKRVETTVVDMAPVCDVTQEIPRVAPVYVLPQDVGNWRPPVSSNSKGNR